MSEQTPLTEAALLGPMHGDKAANCFVSAEAARSIERVLRADITQLTQANANLNAEVSRLKENYEDWSKQHSIEAQRADNFGKAACELQDKVAALETQLVEANRLINWPNDKDISNEPPLKQILILSAANVELNRQLVEARKERDSVLSRVSEIEIIPGQVAVPFFKTDEEYQAFREWWQQNVTEALKRPDVERDQLHERCEKLEALLDQRVPGWRNWMTPEK